MGYGDDALMMMMGTHDTKWKEASGLEKQQGFLGNLPFAVEPIIRFAIDATIY